MGIDDKNSIHRERLLRLLQLVGQLARGRHLSARELSHRLNISERMLYRDIATLRKAGLVIDHSRTAGGYALSSDFLLPPVKMSVLESLAIMLMAQNAEPHLTQPLIRDAREAFAKLLRTMPEELRAMFTKLRHRISTTSRGVESRNIEDVQFLIAQDAVGMQLQIQGRYRGATEPKAKPLDIDPYHLLFAQRAWYLIGYCQQYQAIRTFKLARFETLTLTEQEFDRPAFHIDEYLGNAWLFITEPDIYHVELEFAPKMADNVSQVIWHHTQKHAILPDGRCRMSFDVAGYHEIAWWILGYGPFVKVIQPIALREHIQQMYAQALEQYQEPRS